MKANHIPDKIYFQIGERCPEDFDWRELAEITWSEDQINDNDLIFHFDQIEAKIVKEDQLESLLDFIDNAYLVDIKMQPMSEIERKTRKAITDFAESYHQSKLSSLIEAKMPSDEEIESKLLKLFGFTEDGAVKIKGQLKIFKFCDWLKSHLAEKESEIRCNTCNRILDIDNMTGICTDCYLAEKVKTVYTEKQVKEILVKFGETFKQSEDIDSDIVKFVDDNFWSLF